MKKIIAFALSIAVLFAFAACEAGTIPPYYGKTVESITLLSAPDYIVGETLNPADLSFRVVYDNGEEVTRTGADLGLAPTKTGTDSKLEIDSSGSYEFENATAKTFGIVYGTSRPTSGGVVTEKAIWTCEITPYEAAKVKYVVDPSNAPKEYVAGTDPFEGVVITAKLPKGDKVVSAEIAGIDMDDFDSAETETTVTFTVKSNVTIVTLSSAWTITYSVVEEEVTGITFEYNDELFANTPAADMTTLDKIEFKVHVTYSTGRTKDFATRAAFKSAGGEVDFNGFYDENTKVQEVSTSSINFTATVEYEDYTNSGFDRGHLCPNADRDITSEFAKETFYMSNIAPQNPSLNQQDWKYLEEKCREYVDKGSELFIIAGVYGKGGTNRSGDNLLVYKNPGERDSTEISIPDHFWKVIVILDDGDGDLSRINENTIAFAVDFENKPVPEDLGWEDYTISIDTLESRTGLDFLSALPDDIEESLESRMQSGL